MMDNGRNASGPDGGTIIMHYALLKRFESSLDDKRKAIYDIVDTILLYRAKM